MESNGVSKLTCGKAIKKEMSPAPNAEVRVTSHWKKLTRLVVVERLSISSGVRLGYVDGHHIGHHTPDQHSYQSGVS